MARPREEDFVNPRIAALLLFLAASPLAAEILPGFKLEKLAATSGFLTSIAINSRGVLHYSTTAGEIYRLEGSASVLAAKVDTASGGNEGLLGIAFRSDEQVVAHYVLPDHTAEVIGVVNVVTGEGHEIARLVCDQGRECSSEHHGGNPAIGPDGSTFVGIGDFGGGPRAQVSDSPAGKIFRIAPDGSARVFALGFRNPFDLYFDRVRGKLVVTDNGPMQGDEVHLIGEGENAGWPFTVGEQPQAPGLTGPLYTFPNTVAPTGVTSVSRQGAMPAEGILVGAFVTKAVYYFRWLADERLAPPVAITVGEIGGVIDVVTDPGGTIFVGTGFAVYRLEGPRRGDANGDGAVNDDDFAAIAREILDGDGTETTRAQEGTYRGSWGADVNGDGLIDTRDLVALARARTSRERAVRR